MILVTTSLESNITRPGTGGRGHCQVKAGAAESRVADSKSDCRGGQTVRRRELSLSPTRDSLGSGGRLSPARRRRGPATRSRRRDPARRQTAFSSGPGPPGRGYTVLLVNWNCELEEGGGGVSESAFLTRHGPPRPGATVLLVFSRALSE